MKTLSDRSAASEGMSSLLRPTELSLVSRPSRNIHCAAPDNKLPQAVCRAMICGKAGNTAIFAFVLAVVFVFLVLAAQCESLSLPLAIILIVPMCLVASIVGVMLR